MVRKHNPWDHLGFLAYTIMVHNRYQSDLYEFRRVYSPDGRILFHIILDKKNVGKQAILRTVCSWPCQFLHCNHANIDFAKGYATDTFLDLGNPDVIYRPINYRFT